MSSYVPSLNHKERATRRQEIAQFVSENGSNVTAVSLASQKYSVCGQSVRKACEDCGVAVERNPSGTPQVAMKASTYDIIGELCTQSSPFAAMAARYGVTKQWISQVYLSCQKAGIPVILRKRGRPATKGTTP